MKQYYLTTNIGKCKYVINFHNGVKTHKDGSPFYDIQIHHNKREANKAVKSLQKQGYKPQSDLDIKF